MEAPDFLDLEPEAHIQEACRRLGLPEPLAHAWRTLPEPTFFPDPDVGDDEDEDEDDALAEPGCSMAHRPGEDPARPAEFAPTRAASDSS